MGTRNIEDLSLSEQALANSIKYSNDVDREVSRRLNGVLSEIDIVSYTNKRDMMLVCCFGFIIGCVVGYMVK